MNLIGLLLLVGTFLYSFARVFVIGPEAPAVSRGKTTIRIAHWQLERGFRDALDAVAADYQKIHPDVRVVQLLISEQVYAQWVNTQLVGGTAPDVIAMPGFIRDFYRTLGKYFVPLSEYVEEPNPYNAGTDLEGIPWRQTYIDGMYNAWVPELQEYYKIPYTVHTTRVYYNKDVFREVLGDDRPPRTFAEFMDFCERIEKYGGGKYIPIAGSTYTYWMMQGRALHCTTFSYLPKVDLNYDGNASYEECFLTNVMGRWSYLNPKVKAGFLILRELTSHFQRGFMSVGRDQSVFLFVQAKAAMITTGSWDAKGLLDQSDFDVGVFHWPLPGRDNPKYGRYVEGDLTEADRKSSGSLAITKKTKHFDVVLDFLRFFTSQEMNEKFCKMVLWGPAIRGAEPPPFLRPFMPYIRGYNGGLGYGCGADIVWRQQIPLYLQGQKNYEEFIETYEAALPTVGVRDMEFRLDDRRRVIKRLEAPLVLARFESLEGSHRAEQKYLSSVEMQQDLSSYYHLVDREFHKAVRRLKGERR